MPERFVTIGEAMRRFEIGDPMELEDLYRDGHLPFPYHMEVWPASVFL